MKLINILKRNKKPPKCEGTSDHTWKVCRVCYMNPAIKGKEICHECEYEFTPSWLKEKLYPYKS